MQKKNNRHLSFGKAAKFMLYLKWDNKKCVVESLLLHKLG